MLLLFILFTMLTQTPEQVVQRQLETYNNRDLKGFMSVMSQDVILVNYVDQKVLAQGHQEVKNIYQSLFEQSPELHSTLKNRMVLGHQVIDHEEITGRKGLQEAIELIVIYEVNDDMKIEKITVLRA